MGLFSRRKPEPPPVAWQPPERPGCSCVRHLDDDLLATVVPYSAALVEDLGHEPEPTTVEGLLRPAGLSIHVTDVVSQRLPDSAARFVWTLNVYDDALAHCDGDALGFDDVIAAQPGVEEVDGFDTEIFLVAAPTLCAEGVLAAAALTLLDDRVRATR